MIPFIYQTFCNWFLQLSLRIGYQGLTGNLILAKWAAVRVSADNGLLFCFDSDVWWQLFIDKAEQKV